MNFQKTNPLVYRFWQDSFNLYLRKVKLPIFPTSKNPRKYFHLTAIDRLLRELHPKIVWNLCPGNIRTIFPAINRWILRNNSRDSLLWVNIDILPELQQLNTNILQEYWQNSESTENHLESVVYYQRATIVNLQGTLEAFPSAYESLSLDKLDSNQILLCIDGLPNTVQHPTVFIQWWVNFQQFLFSTFKGWYLTWLNANSLKTKFDFYIDVVKSKHNHPINFIEITPLLLTKFPENVKSTVLPLTKSTFDTMQKLDSNNAIGYVFRFFAKPDRKDLVYQASYISPKSMKIFVSHGISDSSKFIQFFNYSLLDNFLFNKENNFSPKIDKMTFVKSLPILTFSAKSE